MTGYTEPPFLLAEAPAPWGGCSTKVELRLHPHTLCLSVLAYNGARRMSDVFRGKCAVAVNGLGESVEIGETFGQEARPAQHTLRAHLFRRQEARPGFGALVEVPLRIHGPHPSDSGEFVHNVITSFTAFHLGMHRQSITARRTENIIQTAWGHHV